MNYSISRITQIYYRFHGDDWPWRDESLALDSYTLSIALIEEGNKIMSDEEDVTYIKCLLNNIPPFKN